MSIIIEVMNARNAQVLFGTDAEKAKKTYRRLERAVHPDLFNTSHEKADAATAFTHLNNLWQEYNKKTAHATSDARKISTKRAEYTVEAQLSSLDDEVLSALAVTYDAGYKKARVLIAKNVWDSDLVSAYTSSLRTLKEVPKRYQVFYPRLIESFRYNQVDGAHSGLFVDYPENLFTLRQVSQRYSQGISGRDVAWIFRRMLTALGNAHSVGLVHGAPTLDAFSIDPIQHILILHSWQYSRKVGESLLSIPLKDKALYSQNVLNKAPVSPSLDINIASRTALALLGNKASAPLVAFFKGCQVSSTPPAAELLYEFDELLLRLYGKPEYHSFSMQ